MIRIGLGQIFFKGKEIRNVIEQIYELFLYQINYFPNTISSLPKMWVSLSKNSRDTVIIKIQKERKIIKDNDIRNIIENIYNLENNSLWIEKTRALRISLSNKNRETIIIEI